MRKKSYALVFGCALLIVTVLSIPMLKFCYAEEIKLSLASFVPPKHNINTTATAWAEEITKRTGGKVKITLYPAQSLLAATKMYEGVLSGAADIGIAAFTYNAGLFPVMMSLDQALNIQSATAGTKVANALYKKYRPTELSKIKVIYLFTTSPIGIATNKPQRTLGSLKGKIIRTTGGQGPMMKRFGASVVALPMSEALMSIRKGMVDGCTVSMDVMRPMKIGDVAKYVTMTEHSIVAFWMGMNLDTWNSLPKDIQEIIDQVSEEWIEHAGADWDDAAAKGIEYLKGLGGEVITLSEKDLALKKELLKPLIEEYIVKLNEKGLAGNQIIEDVNKLTEKYK